MQKPVVTTIKKERLQSLDVLRGFDMFWIIGGGSLIVSLSKINSLSWLTPIALQMKHPDFLGFTFWDLIFPLFMFISGITIPYALLSKVEKGADKKPLQWKIIKRAITLIIFGLLYNGTLRNGFAEFRFSSVLGQIGTAYFIGATIMLHTKRWQTRLGWTLFITLLITTLHLFIPVPGHGAGVFTPEGTINALIDQHLLPGTLKPGPYDQLGVICVISASFLILIGAFTGLLLRSARFSGTKNSLILLTGGVIFLLMGLLLHPIYPVIKVIWTMSFNFLTVGISLMLFALFYYIIDVKKPQNRICTSIFFFFKVIGLNSITIYMGRRIVPFNEISKFFTGWLIEPFGSWIVILVAIIIEWFLLYYLYKNKIFLKV